MKVANTAPTPELPDALSALGKSRRQLLQAFQRFPLAFERPDIQAVTGSDPATVYDEIQKGHGMLPARQDLDAFQFSPDLGRVATFRWQDMKTVFEFWDAKTGEKKSAGVANDYRWRNDKQKVISLFSGNSSRFAFFSHENYRQRVYVWDALQGAPLTQALPVAGRAYGFNLMFSSNGNRLVTVSSKRIQNIETEVWNAETGEKLCDVKSRSFSLSPDGALVLEFDRTVPDQVSGVSLGCVSLFDDGFRFLDTASGNCFGVGIMGGSAIATALSALGWQTNGKIETPMEKVLGWIV